MKNAKFFPAIRFVLGIAFGLSACQPSAFAQIRFNQQVRPLLSDKCFFCHGPDASKREADLRLDLLEEAIGVGAITPGDPATSKILQRMLSDDPDTQMPPPSSKLARLTSSEVETVRAWIAEGAKNEKHWSFEPLDFIGFKDRAKTDPIDGFVRESLLKRGIGMQPKADRNTLARRAAFDVTGLPPLTPILQTFLDDQSPNAWENYLNTLLESKAYGERMAVDWLDIARYSDSYGFQVDRERMMWPWRDWVVTSFNENKPFDEFIIEQLAGDLLPSASRNQILATAFNRLHQQESEGGSVEEEYRVEYVADRVQTYATAFLGLTFECARCHDHKFDPITQREYYQLFSIFQNVDEAGLYSYFTNSPPTPALGLTDDSTDKRIEVQKDVVASVVESLIGAKESQRKEAIDWVSKQARFLTGESPQNAENDSNENKASKLELRSPLMNLSFDSAEDRNLPNSAKADSPAKLEGDNVLVPGRFGQAVQFNGDEPVKTKQGNFARHEPFSVSLWLETPDVKERAVVFHRSRAWTDAASRGYELLIEDGRLKWSLIHFWPGNAISIKSKEPLPIQTWTHVVVSYDGSSRADGLQMFVDGNRLQTEMVRDCLTKEITGGGGDSIDLAERFRDRGFRGGKIDEFRVFAHALSAWEAGYLFDPEKPLGASPIVPEMGLLKPLAVSSLLEHYFATQSDEVQQLTIQLAAERKKLYDLEDSVTEIMVMREMSTAKPAFVLTRGEYNLQGVEVHAATPAFLSPFPETLPKNRLGLARWTVARNHPLTARVTVNRVWQSIFGRGLVKTSEDFGSQGSRPLYPQVLDALAIQFVENGWNMKALVKTILMSDTYQQRSVSNAANMADDPENELLARGPRFRLPAEMIRDNALSIAGLLDLKQGGAPVNPYEMSESFKPTKWSDGDGVYRRSLYTNWRRTGPPPAMITFDAPRRAVCVAKREQTDSPLQALVLLNGIQYVDAARAFASQLIAQHKDDEDGLIRTAFQRCLTRAPDDTEMRIARQLLREQTQYFEKDETAAKDFLHVGRSPINDSVSLATLAGTTALCQALMNHDTCVVKR